MPTIDVVRDAIIEKSPFDVIARGMWNRFVLEKATAFEWDEPQKADGIPILARTKIGPQIVNHKLHSPFDRTIVNTKTAYFASNVAVVFEEGFPEDVVDFYQKTNYSNAMDCVYEELATYAADSGTSYVLLTKDGADISVTSIEPWHAIVMHDKYTKRPMWGAIYDEDKVTVYDEINAITYEVTTEKGKSVYSRSSVKPHGFGTKTRPGIPLIEFPNNPNRIGNAVMTISMQDAYDILLSDVSSELSQTRLSYLLLKGMGEDDAGLIEKMKSNGIILVDDKDGDATFVTKDIKVDAVRVLQEDLRRLIFEGANSYDPASFADGKTPPTAYEVNERLHPLEMDCQTTIKAWGQSLRYVDYLVQTFLITFVKVGEYDTAEISRIFRRVAPRNTMGALVEARQAGMVLSNDTKIELSGLQIDPRSERMRLDQEGVVKQANNSDPSGDEDLDNSDSVPMESQEE